MFVEESSEAGRSMTAAVFGQPHARGFVYALTDEKLKITFPDGKTEEIAMKTGEARWRDPVTHAVENVGTTEAQVIAVELKKPAK